MADCNDLFLEYHEKITLPKSKKNSLKKSKIAVREKIKNWFSANQPEYVPQFYIQGSYKCNNAVLSEEKTCDLDDGVYFLREPDKSGTTIQKWVLKALEGHTSENPKHLKKCIRVIYKDDCNIDIPVLYKRDKDAHPHIAIKNMDWGDDDPKEFVEWYKKAKGSDGQLNRIVKYLKSWAKNKRHKMPNGLCLTILAESNITTDERDDICLHETLENISAKLNSTWECKMPTFPFDNLFDEYDDVLKRNFLASLASFIEASKKAIKTNSKHEASKEWEKHLGKRFPIADKTEEEEKAESLLKAAIAIKSGNHFTSKSGQINKEKDGVKNKEHRFYGE